MLTAAEQQELAQLEQEEAQAQMLTPQVMPQPQAAPMSVQPGLTPEEQAELAQLEQEEQQAAQASQQMAQVSPDEADLGFSTRLKYSIEPLESNRLRLLIDEFGGDNVIKDEKGDVYLKQGGKIRPVNAPGLSFTDVADVAGAVPEMAGAGAGALMGLGVASVPGAMAGGAAGSAARQGLSAMLGTPQVATPQERATEIGLSALLGAGGTLVGKGAKGLAKKLFPKFKMSKEGAKIIKIAQKGDIPEPTVGQVAGGRDLDLEKALMERPIFGRNIRKRVNAQVDKIKENFAEQVGEFIGVDSSREAAGRSLKELAEGNIAAIKQTAGGLFDEVAEKGVKVKVPAQKFKNELIEAFSELNLFDEFGNPLEHSSRTGLTESQFGNLQRVFGKILKDIDASQVAREATEAPGTALVKRGARPNFIEGMGPEIDANTINTMRKFIDGEIREAGQQQLDDLLLRRLRNNFLDVTENMLGAQDKGLAEKFKEARALWHKQLELSKIYSKAKHLGLKDAPDKKVIERIFKSPEAVRHFKELVSAAQARKAGIEYLHDILTRKLGKEDAIATEGLYNMLREKREELIEAIGRDAYKKFMGNLFYLQKIGKPINPSRTKIIDLMVDLSPGGLASGALQTGVRTARTGLRRSVEKLPQRAGGLTQLLTDPTQRQAAALTRGPKALISEDERQKRSRPKRKPARGR